MVLWQLLRWGRVPRRRYPNLVHHRVRRYAPANATPLRRCVYIYCTLLRIRLSCEAKRFASRQTSLWRSGWLTSSTRLQRIAILDTSSLNDAPHQPLPRGTLGNGHAVFTVLTLPGRPWEIFLLLLVATFPSFSLPSHALQPTPMPPCKTRSTAIITRRQAWSLVV